MSIDLLAGVTVAVEAPQVPEIHAAPPSSQTVVVPVAGPQGPQGEPGAGAGTGYSHTQLTVATTWTVSHNLGYHPAGIQAWDSSGSLIEYDQVIYDTTTTLRLLFLRAVSGSAELS